MTAYETLVDELASVHSAAERQRILDNLVREGMPEEAALYVELHARLVEVTNKLNKVIFKTELLCGES